MTLQARGLRWSVGIHAIVLVLAVAVQLAAVSPIRTAVIDFTLAGREAAREQAVGPPAPPARREVRRAAPARPREAVPEPRAPLTPPAETPALEEAVIGVARAPAGNRPPGAGASTSGAVSGSGTASAPITGSGRGATAPTSEQSRATYLREHFAYIRDLINRSIAYPAVARKMGWTGEVRIAFTVCEDGGARDVRILESSGIGLLDRNAVETVKSVAPFPRPPIRAEIRMAILYRLN